MIEQLIPNAGLVNIYGKPKTAKSFAAIGMAIAISSGLPEWNGWQVQTHGPVVYIQLDTPRPEWKKRFSVIAGEGHDISKIAIIDLNIAPYPYNIMSPKHQKWLKLQLDSVNPVFTVIDTLREAHDGDENSSKEMKMVVNTIVQLARPSAVAFISHSRKDFNAMGPETDLMDEGRGSSYISGRMDTVIKFTGMKGKKNKGKGHMYYKGRAIEEGSISITQDATTGLPYQDVDEAKRLSMLNEMIRDHGPGTTDGWTINKMAEELVLKDDWTLKKRMTAERLGAMLGHLKVKAE